MESEIKSSSRICPVTPISKKGLNRHLRPRTIFMAVSLTLILTTTGLLNSGMQPPPQPSPPPLPPSLVPETNSLVVCEAADNLGYLGLDWGGTLDPAWTWGVFDVYLSSCYDTLVTYDRERVDRFRPLLVTEVPSLENGRISSDGLTYRFTIRSDSPLTPEDVEYSFERLMVCGGFWANPTWMLHEVLLGVRSIWDDNDTLLASFEDIDNAVDVEGNDVVFHLARTCPQFMQILASSCSSILSKAWCVREGDWSGTEETWLDYVGGQERSPLASETQGYGPFMLERYSYGGAGYGGYEEVVLVRNVDYWRGPAPLERVEFRVYGYSLPFDHAENWKTRKQTFLDGDADICYVPEENYGELDDVEGIRIYTGLPTLEYHPLDFHFSISNISPFIGSGELDGNGIPPDFFSDIDIRKAFAYCLDYNTIVHESYAGEARQPTSPVLEGLPFHNPDQETYTYDLDMALQHFQHAWGGEVWNKGFKLTLVYAAADEGPPGEGWGWLGVEPLTPKTVEILKDNIEALNTKFHVTLLKYPSSGDWFSNIWNLTAFICPGPEVPYLPDPNSFVAPFLHCTGKLRSWEDQKISTYNSSTIDNLIEAGMNTVDPSERQIIYYELQSIYHEDALGIPLVQPLTRHYQRDWVWGWYHNPAAGMNLYEMLKGTYQDATRNIITHVEDLVDGEVLGADAGNLLTETLDSAIALMDKGNLTEASQVLNDFIDQVNALDLPVWDREELTALAQEITEVLTPTPTPTTTTPTDGGFDVTMTPLVGVGVAAIVLIVLVVWKARWRI